MGTALLFSQFTWAQETLEEVIVTAQKKEQNLQDVGISVNAFTSEDIAEMRIETAKDIGKNTPNVDIKASNSFGNPVVSIRGVGLNDFSSNGTPAAGVYVDEVYLSSTAMMSSQLFDLERIEVLKGPQGTLYGRNTPAGAINFVTRKPTQEFDSYVTATVGNYKHYELEAAVGGGLSDSLSGRISAKTIQQKGGYWNSSIFGEHGEMDVFTIRGQLLWDINDDADLLLMVHGDKDRSDSPLWEWNGSFNASLFDPAFTGLCDTVAAGRVKPNIGCTDIYGYSDQNEDPFEGDWRIPAYIESDGKGGRATLNWEIDDMLFTSITAVEKLDRFADDGDTVGNPDTTQFNTIVDTNIDQFSQELRLSGGTDLFDWIVGGFYGKDEVSDHLTVNTPDLFGALADLNPLDTLYDQETTVKALYAHTEWHVSDAVTLIGGLRYNDEQVKFAGCTYATFVSTGDVLCLTPQDDKISFKKTLWKTGINWSPADNYMVYASIGNGFKSGGFFGGTALDPEAVLPYGPEDLIAYEAGVKSRLAGNKLQLNASVFYYDYRDIQQFTEVVVGGLQITKLSNIPNKSTVKGLDLELWWLPVDGLDIRFGLGLLDTKLGDFTNEGTLYSGNKLANAPDVSSNISGRYEWGVSSGLVMSAMAAVSYSDSVFKSATNNALFLSDSYTLVDGRLAIQNESRTWELALWGKNLGDEQNVQEAFGDASLGTLTRSYNAPRTYGLTYSYFWQ